MDDAEEDEDNEDDEEHGEDHTTSGVQTDHKQRQELSFYFTT